FGNGPQVFPGFYLGFYLGEIRIAITRQLQVLHFFQKRLLLLKMLVCFLVFFVTERMKTIKIMVTGLLETLPYFIAFAALDKSDLLPVGLDFFHQWSGLFKIVTVLMRFGYFYQLEFLLEILVLLFFSVLV